MAHEISTTEYQFAHGKVPRGRGHWAFWLRPFRGAPDARSELYFVPGEKLYSEARCDAECRAYDIYARDAFVAVAS